MTIQSDFSDNEFVDPVTDSAKRVAAYEVCKERGHTDSGLILTSNPPWSVCEFCGTNYRYETKLIEGRTPLLWRTSATCLGSRDINGHHHDCTDPEPHPPHLLA